MRFVLGFLCGVIGLIAGWLGVAAAVISVWGLGNDGGIAMAAFFQAGPIGGLVGLLAGVLLFIKIDRFRTARNN
jgi:hypothetical protein